MQTLLRLFLDFLFPPTKEALVLETITPETAEERLVAAPPTSEPFITSIFSYKDPIVTELVLSIKNRKNAHSVTLAAHALYKELRKSFQEPLLLVPIPLSRKRRRERGYNQCELLIDEIMKLDADNQFEKNFQILLREKDAGQQKLKGRRERISSTASIFRVDYVPTEKTVVLIDDVVTTGSTLKEARRVLLSRGYKNVSALTIAH